MNQSPTKLLQFLTGKDSLDDVSVEELIKLVDENPYFAIGRYLLAKKMKKAAAANYEKEVQVTALYFPDPLRLHYQLHEDEIVSVYKRIYPDTYLKNKTASVEAAGNSDKEQQAPVRINGPYVSLPATIEQIAVPYAIDNRESEPPPGEPHVITTEFTQQEIETASDLAHVNLDELATRPNETLIFPEGSVTAGTTEQLPGQEQLEHPITDEFSQDEIEKASDLAAVNLDDTSVHPEDTLIFPGDALPERPQYNPDDTGTPNRSLPPTPTAPQEETVETIDIVRDNLEQVILETQLPNEQIDIAQQQEETAAITRETHESAASFAEQAATAHSENIAEDEQDNQQEEVDEHERMFRNIKAMLEASDADNQDEQQENLIPIDPYYTIDYFASQGIRLELEQNPQDPLGKNLRKFTDWLKHMKRLGPEDATEEIIKTESEEEIQQIADSSNTAREVVTEAMAQVLEKQGKKSKAIELYNKLIFLNPDKSTYFAAKIKNLKGS